MKKLCGHLGSCPIPWQIVRGAFDQQQISEHYHCMSQSTLERKEETFIHAYRDRVKARNARGVPETGHLLSADPLVKTENDDAVRRC